jgi:hypothetical protein
VYANGVFARKDGMCAGLLRGTLENTKFKLQRPRQIYVGPNKRHLQPDEVSTGLVRAPRVKRQPTIQPIGTSNF